MKKSHFDLLKVLLLVIVLLFFILELHSTTEIKNLKIYQIGLLIGIPLLIYDKWNEYKKNREAEK
jgi:hypothetical protein